MSRPDVRRSIVSMQLLARFGGDRGVPLSTCLKDTGLSAEALALPQTEATAAQELQLVRNLLGALGPIPGLGLDAGLRYRLSAYGIWGFALLSSPVLRDAVQVAERYLDLSFAFVRFRTHFGPEVARTVLDDRDIPEDVRQFLLERDFAAWANASRELQLSGPPVRRVCFRFARPAYAERFATLSGCEPEYGAAENLIEIDAAMMDAPLPQGNAEMARLSLEQCRQVLARRQVRTGFAGQVRDCLFQRAGRMPALESVAEELRLSPRSLRRHLEAEGTSFRALADEVLETLAEELLTVANMKLEEVAMRLGYAEPASFIHAFKRWKGVSPNSFREQRRNSPEMATRP